ncbi:hypothetical protein F5883DRAFT_547475 [Diaporthe sp. PMI_573]|nr:hypothetical protein F5883DRAFT_547475 [Diaporthaceae sp. PMI_573]
MDTAQPKGRLRAFLKHATVRISSTKDHGFANDSASTYSIDDDDRSQRSSKSAKKDSKLRRLGRGIREWRSKRRRLHGDTRPTLSHTLEGKSFSSSDGSLAQESFETEEDLTDEDERVDDPVDEPEDHALEASEGVRGEPPEEKLQLEIIHKEVAVRQRPRGHVTPRDTRKEAAIRRRILEQYYELRSLGAWVEFHWIPAHSGLSGNEIADRMAALSLWWLAKAAPHSGQGAALVMPLKVLTFDEPWTRFCPHKGQPQHTKNLALQLLEDTQNFHVVLSTKALGPASCNRTVGPTAASPGPEVMTRQQPTARGPRKPLHPPSVDLAPEVGKAMVNPSASSIKGGYGPNHDSLPGPQYQVVPMPIPQPPTALPQPPSKVRAKRKGKKKRAELKNSPCTHCGNHGHLIHECFGKFPEQKVAFPQRYVHYGGRKRLEKVFPGAFQNLARLHPQLMPQTIHGQDYRYMIGQIGISPHLTPKQCAVWAVRYQEAQPCRDTTGAQSVQDQRRYLREKYRWDEAQGAQLD